jgi:hypothetical protein
MQENNINFPFGIKTNTLTRINNDILLEKRKRHQNYLTLNYFIGFGSYFDFFSFDMFNIVKNSQILAQSCNSKELTNTHLLLPFLEIKTELVQILEEFGITKKVCFDLVNQVTKNRVLPFLNFWPFLQKKVQYKNYINVSQETSFTFEKAAENALLRFKTPIITPEILFITLMEQTNTQASQHIKKILINRKSWYSLRYKLLKRIHFSESHIRNSVPKNQQYFAYLLKTQIADVEFERLINNNMLALGILFFRNKLLSKIRSFSMPEFIEKETYKSISLFGKRKYST